MPVRVIDLSAAFHPSDANQGHISPQSCTLLSVGQAFSGTQNVSNLQKDEAWRVNVRNRIQGCDLDHGYLCGTMEALNVPMTDTPVNVGSRKSSECDVFVIGAYTTHTKMITDALHPEVTIEDSYS